ncbi:terminase family protein [Methanosphaera sp. ISO3-F5]|uniref:terminase large subunit domain-containing protein n=1 Tax=Methanosphaera sp. ISO3-F5 TaxID=1452353 RepID=UPI002B2584CC|nr:terminase family protein [Methanosphaera sp. ISO3-F5]WQH64090.1 terminase family protein [Methanosphaera sp. ISO3-F5]
MMSTKNTYDLLRYPSDTIYDWFLHIHYNTYHILKWQLPIYDILRYAEEGKVSRIMISAPPQHGKTELLVNTFISYYMVNNPNDKIIVTAYSESRATKYGSRIRDIIKEFGKDTLKKPVMKQDYQRKTNFLFDSPYEGELLAAGAHGAIMGNPANLILIDDPIKEIKDARSPTLQEDLKDWYDTSIDTRIRKRYRKNKKALPPIIIVVAQRLDVRDLQGILLEKEPNIDGKEALHILENGGTIPDDTWVYMNFPALSEGETEDILGRPKDTPLWSKHKNYEDLLADRRRRGTQRFNMIMQGHPTLETSYRFKHEWFYDSPDYNDENLTCLVPYSEYNKLLPTGRFWDLAAHKKKKKTQRKSQTDYYSGVLASKDYTTDYLYILHHERSRRDVTAVNKVIRTCLKLDGMNTFAFMELEPGSMPLLFVDTLQQQFPGYNIMSYHPREDKMYRSYELKRLAENHCIKFVVHEGQDISWVHTFIKELEDFDGEDSNPNKDKHDDIVDSGGSAANYFKMNKNLYVPY